MIKLKLGIMLDSYFIPDWAYRSLKRVRNLENTQIQLVILNETTDSRKPRSYFYSEKKYNFSYRLFNKIDRAIFRRDIDAYSTKNCQELLDGVPELRVKITNLSNPGCFDHSDIKKIKKYNLDILIRMGFAILSGEILDSARFGVWSYHFGDADSIDYNIPGFWETIHRIPITGSTLSILNDDTPVGKIIDRSWVQTYMFSPYRNRNRSSWLASSFLPRQIELLGKIGKENFYNKIQVFNDDFEHKGLKKYQTPKNLRILWIFISLFFRNFHEIIRRFTVLYHWRLLVNFSNSNLHTCSNFAELIPPRDRFWADPHVIHLDDKYYVFVEEYIYREKKGRLSVLDIEPDGKEIKSTPILSTDHHLSYPFVFNWNGRYFLVPETASNRTIELYESIKFPFDWHYKMNLMENVLAVDTTLFFYNDKWWLFTGITENEGAFPEVELFLFYSTQLFSQEWIPHPLNPIVSDVRKARPAGKIFMIDGKILRPSQDCSKIYGWGFDLNEILQLSETQYREQVHERVRPDWDRNILGIHTISSEGSLTVIDACRIVRKYF
jgi:hypothetical protein